MSLRIHISDEIQLYAVTRSRQLECESDALPFFAVSISSYAYTFVGTTTEMNTTTKAANNAIVFLMNILDITIPPFIIPLKNAFLQT